MFDLTGKAALVTGATGDIGKAIAEALHRAGADVALSGTREGHLADLAAALGDRAHVTPGDLATPDGAETVVKAAETAMGKVDILVNNAGITRDNLAMRMKDEEFLAVLEVNLLSSFRCARATLRGMMRRRWGRIIGVSSIIGFIGNPGQANYAASKAGLAGMMRSLAAELASRNITANCVAPGFIESAMTESLPEDVRERARTAVPLARFGQPRDVAAGVVFLASEEACYITGQTLHINGGMAMF